MKKTILIFAGLLMIAFTNQLKAQTSSATETANATANIVQPLQINKIVDLDFGDIAAGTAIGTVTIDATTGNRTSTGGVTLIATNDGNEANFEIQGYANATFSIALPTSIIISSGSDDMTVDNFVSSLGAAGTLDALGEADLNVGADLHVDANQTPGLYIGTFDVTVAYN
jgi:hypothetical protein